MKSNRNSIIKAKFHIATFILFIVTSSSSIAQDIPSSVQLQYPSRPWSIGLEVGYSSFFIGGEAKKGINDMLGQFEGNGNENLEFKRRINPILSLNIGGFLDYRIKETLSLRGGIRLNKRGYSVRINGEERDAEFQYDQKMSYKEDYRLTTFEFPLSASYIPNDRILFTGGILVGMARKNTSIIEASINQEVIINGEISDDLSSETLNRRFSLTDNVNNPFFGVFAAVDYRIYSKLFLGASIQRAENYAKLDYGNLSDTSISMSLKYLLPQF